MEDELPCPTCGKKLALPSQNTQCSRCGLDFTSLLQVRAAGERLQQQALRSLCEGAYDEALVSATESWNLVHRESSARLAYLTCLMQGDIDTANEWWQAAS